MSTSGHAVVCGLAHLGVRMIDELRARDETVVGIGASTDLAASSADPTSDS